MDLGLTDRVVFVAGSSRGIGRGIAATLLEEGARVVLTGRDAASLAAACAELSKGHPSQVTSFAGDLTQPAVVQAAHDMVNARWGAVDCLICNVGSGSAKNGLDIRPEDWERAFSLNLWASVRLVEVFLPRMIQARRGNIIFVGSIAGLENLGAPIPYGAAKAALEHYSKDLSGRAGKSGVRVNTVAPGNILFPGGSWEKKLEANSAGVMSMINAEVPLGRFGSPEEIGAAVAFLASDRAAFITGACLVVDGGQTRA